MGTSIAKAEEKFLATFKDIDDAANAYLSTLGDSTTSMMQTIRRASAIDTIKRSLTDEIINAIVLPMMDDPMGFKTDRANEETKYPVDVIRNCICNVMLHGGRIDGNEFNIIKGQPMLVQNYWKRMVRECDRITDLAVEFGGVHVNGSEAFVECLARWKCDGRQMEISRRANVKHAGTEWDRRIVVPMNRAMGRDAVIGKAERRIYKEIYEQTTGRRIQGMDEDDVIDAESSVVERPEESAADEKPESGSLFPEDSQDVADFQSQLKGDYFSELANKDTKEGVKELMEHAKANKKLTPHTLEEIIQAGTNKYKSLKG